MDDLRELCGYVKFVTKLNSFNDPDGNFNDDAFNTWLADLGLLHRRRTCDKVDANGVECGSEMIVRTNLRGVTTWRCPIRDCKRERGYFIGTFFENSHLSPKEVFLLSFCWSRKTRATYDEIETELRRPDGSTISTRTLVDWMQFFRDVCMEYFVRNPARIGGINEVVEIDETYVC